MAILIQIDDELYAQAKAAATDGRTAPKQIELWARVGKAALANPDIPATLIWEIIVAGNQPSESFQFME